MAPPAAAAARSLRAAPLPAGRAAGPSPPLGFPSGSPGFAHSLFIFDRLLTKKHLFLLLVFCFLGGPDFHSPRFNPFFPRRARGFGGCRRRWAAARRLPREHSSLPAPSGETTREVLGAAGIPGRHDWQINGGGGSGAAGPGGRPPRSPLLPRAPRWGGRPGPCEAGPGLSVNSPTTRLADAEHREHRDTQRPHRRSPPSRWNPRGGAARAPAASPRPAPGAPSRPPWVRSRGPSTGSPGELRAPPPPEQPARGEGRGRGKTPGTPRGRGPAPPGQGQTRAGCTPGLGQPPSPPGPGPPLEQAAHPCAPPAPAAAAPGSSAPCPGPCPGRGGGGAGQVPAAPLSAPSPRQGAAERREGAAQAAGAAGHGAAAQAVALQAPRQPLPHQDREDSAGPRLPDDPGAGKRTPYTPPAPYTAGGCSGAFHGREGQGQGQHQPKPLCELSKRQGRAPGEARAPPRILPSAVPRAPPPAGLYPPNTSGLSRLGRR